jgi:hypothetical protein
MGAGRVPVVIDAAEPVIAFQVVLAWEPRRALAIEDVVPGAGISADRVQELTLDIVEEPQSAPVGHAVVGLNLKPGTALAPGAGILALEVRVQAAAPAAIGDTISFCVAGDLEEPPRETTLSVFRGNIVAAVAPAVGCGVVEVTAGAAFVRGDANADGMPLNIGDALFILQYLFVAGPEPSCMDAADANDSQGVDMSDGVYILQRLFAGGSALPPPHPGCGRDLTADTTGCRRYEHCDGS